MNSDGRARREPLVKIKISNLAQGRHHYRFALAVTDFQDSALSAQMFPNLVEATVSLEKGLSDITVAIAVNTVAAFECDRCLAALHRRISGEYRIFYAQAKSAQTEGLQDEVRALGKNDFEIDLTDDIRDTLLLAVPMKNVCEPACAHQVGQSAAKASESAPETEWQKALRQLSQKFNENTR